MRVRSVVALTVLLALGAACGSDGGSGSGGRPYTGIKRTPPLEVGSVTLPEVAPDDGSTFTMKASAPDRLLVVYFGYTNCPDLCPTTLSALRGAFKEIGAPADRVDVAFATVDPARDTPDVLAGYLSSFFTGHWHALRTEDDTVLKAAEEPFLVTSSVETTFDGRISVTHTAATYVIDDTGTVVIEWGYPTKAEDMTADLRQLLEETA